MAFNVQDIRSNLTGGGARPTLFQVQITNPADSSADLKTPFMIKATQIPAATLGQTIVPYMGRQIKLAGDRTYEPWMVNVINDEDFSVRNALETWSNKINSFQGNLRGFGTSSPLQYKSTALVTQFSKTGEAIRTYRFDGLFPIEIGTIDLNWDQQDQIEEFQVTFAYDWWSIDSGTTGDAGGS